MLIKTARAQIVKVGYLKDLKFDLRKDEFWSRDIDRTMSKMAALQPIARYLDDFIYTRQRAISAYEFHGFNGNKDAFREKQLLQAHPTFINTGFYKDHKNWDKRFAYGINLDSRFHPNHFVEVISAVSRSMQPDSEEVVSNILSGKWCETSMGAEVQVSVCSYCDNRATREAEFCDHIRYAKGSKLDGRDVFEFNEGLNFFDESIITTEAAEREALITEVFDKDDLNKKASQNREVITIIRTPHLDVKCCSKCAEQIVPDCNEGKCGMQQEKAAAMLSTTTIKDEHSDRIGGDVIAPLPNSELKQGDQMETQAIVKKAEEGSKPDADSVKANPNTPPSSAKPAEDYNRGEKPEVAAFNENKKGSEATSKATVGKEDQISQQKDKDYPREGSAKTGVKQPSRLSALRAAAAALLGLADAEQPSATSANTEAIAAVKASARKAIARANVAHGKLDARKAALLSRISKTKIASMKRKAEDELKDLNEDATALDGHAEDMDGAIDEANKMEDGMAAGGPATPEETVIQLQQDVLDSIEEVKEIVMDLAGEEAAENSPAEDKAADDKDDEEADEKKEASLSKKSEESKQPEGKQEAGNAQLLVDRGDYNRSSDPFDAASSDLKSQESATRSDIDRQRAAGFGTPAEQIQQREIRLASNRYYRGLRAAGLKHATASRKVRAWVADFRGRLSKVAASPAVEDLKKQLVDEISDKMVDEILDTRPGEADLSGVGAPPSVETPEEAAAAGGEEAKPAEMFGTPPVQVSSAKEDDDKAAKAKKEKAEKAKKDAAKSTIANNHKDDCDCSMCEKMDKKDAAFKFAQGDPKSSETPGPKASGELPADPADAGWDLFPDDKVTETAARANSEQESALRQDMKGTMVSEGDGSESKFRETLKSKGDVSKDEQRRMAQAIEMAQCEVDAGLIEESQLESESKRLFLMSPSELQATASMVDRARKLASFQHPDANDPTILKSAVLLGQAAQANDLDGHLFDD